MAKIILNAEQRRERAVRVHDPVLVEEMADTVAARQETLTGRIGCENASRKAKAATEASLKAAAALVKKAEQLGYSPMAALGLLNQGEARAYERAAIVNGAEASGRAPIIDEGKAKVKSDGRGQGNKMARQRRRIGREDQQPASFWYKENEGEAQKAYSNPDAADTGEWFG